MQKNDKIIVTAELSAGILSLKPTTKEEAAALTRWNTNRSPDGDDIEVMYPDTGDGTAVEHHCYCYTCNRGFDKRGIARHRSMHRDRGEDCAIRYHTRKIVQYNYSTGGGEIILVSPPPYAGHSERHCMII